MKTHANDLSFWRAPLESIRQFNTNPSSLRTDQFTWTGPRPEQRSAFHFVMQIVRNRSLIDHLIDSRTQKAPKAQLKAVLSLGVIQLLEQPDDIGTHAKIIHHTVNLTRVVCSNNESKFVNAVCRSISRTLANDLKKLETAKNWKIRYSHPKWLIQRWTDQIGKELTLELLKWNQQIPQTYLHDMQAEPATSESNPPSPIAGLQPTQWPHFYRFNKSDYTTIEQLLGNRFYVQDPSTRIAPSLFSSPTSTINILDACASPGGKSVHLYKRLQDASVDSQSWIATDLSPTRLKFFEENMTRLGIAGIQPMEANWETGIPSLLENQLFDWVIVDAPCTSVGVIQRHPEIRWRLTKADYQTIPAQQLSILKTCSRTVKPGGELVYSTCSFDASENQQIIREFLASEAGNDFSLITGTTCIPQVEKHDGVGAFLLRKSVC